MLKVGFKIYTVENHKLVPPIVYILYYTDNRILRHRISPIIAILSKVVKTENSCPEGQEYLGLLTV